jgi:hypothetical protein
MRYTKIAALFAASTLAASAYPIAIVNADFETGGFAVDAFSNNPGVIPAGWSAVGPISGAFYGYYNPDSSAYEGTNGPGVATNMSGPNVFYFGSAVTGQGIQQTLGETFAADTAYSLVVALGSRNDSTDFTASLDVVILAGATPIASATFRNNAFDGTFADYSLDYAYNPAHFGLIGQPLTIRFLENNTVSAGELDIDNIRMTAIPEPASAALLLGLGVLGFGLARRRPSA